MPMPPVGCHNILYNQMRTHAVAYLMTSLLATSMRTTAAFATGIVDTHACRSALLSRHFMLIISHQQCYRQYQGGSSARNRFARFRRRRSGLQLALAEAGADTCAAQLIAKDCMKLLSRKGKTWDRLGDIVDLAISSSKKESNPKSRIADVGCDHGLLSIALAASGKYEQVIGVDVSEQALENGARKFHRKVLEALARDIDSSDTDLPVEFRAGDGLSAINDGETDSLAIAGMGVNTMVKILNGQDLERVGTSTLFLQPTNTKPSNLIKLYDHLQDGGWTPQQELLKYISRRWYFSISFERDVGANRKSALPGDKLGREDDDLMHREFMRYVDHHRQWLERDLRAKGGLSEEESRWFDVYGSPAQ